MQKIDTKSLLANSNIVEIIEKHVPLKKRGSEFYGVCPFHDDEKESLQVNESKQVFKCFACDGVGGDSIKFLMLLGRNFHEACEEINGGEIEKEITVSTHEKKKRIVEPVWKPAPLPWPDYPEGFKHFEFGVPSKVWAYHNAAAVVMGYVARFDITEGEKHVLPLTYATNGTKSQWRWLGLPTPRPLYNLHLITENPDAKIIVVEGEKTADAAQEFLNPAEYVVTAWIGGAMGIKNAKWAPLEGRDVILWPDHDTLQKYGNKHQKAGEIKPWHEQPGNFAMLAINELIKEISTAVKWVDVPEKFPHKWDAADQDWSKNDDILEFIKRNLVDVPAVPESENSETDESDPVELKIVKMTPESKKNPPLPPVDDTPKQSNISLDDYFRFLGYDTDENSRLVYYFFSYDAKSVIKLSPSSMSKANLMMLAPINVWEDRFRGGGRQKLNIDAAQQYLMMKSHQTGVFREKYIRGRGAWLDDKKIIIHTGEHLLVGNEQHSLKGFKSKFVYQIGENLDIGTENGAKSKQAVKLIEQMNWLEWERGVNAYLLAGWCVIAPFCGVLDWRPHIWVTGPAGSGKSWVMDNIIKRLMGEVAIVVQGKTTEAGVRGMLQSDARPVLFDESDVDGYTDRERIQSVLALARSSSYRDGGVIGKGTQSGAAKSYSVRSCFAFSSIGIQLNQQSDRSRFTTLGLRSFEKTKSKEDFAKFELNWNKTFNVDFVHRLQSRTMQLLPVILKNAHTFADAAAHLIGNRRIGDQIGGMLAGAYSLTSAKVVTYETALEWCKKRDWEDEKGLEATKDENQLFATIISYVVDLESQSGFLKRTIGELVLAASGKENAAGILKETAADRLRRIGIIVREDELLIANNAPGIKEIIKNTAWARGHNKVLERIEGARKVEPRRFVPGLNSRSVAVPLSMLLEGSEIGL